MSNFRLSIFSLWLLVGLAVFSAASAAASISDTAKVSIAERINALERISNNQALLIQQLQQQLNASQNDIDSLRNAIQQNTYQLNQAVERQKDLFLQLDKLATKPATPPAAGSNQEKSESMLNTTPAPAVKEPTKPANAENDKLSALQSADANKEYTASMDLILVSKQYDKAITALQAWIKRFPQSTYQPNANYWLGQLYYTKKQPDQASYYFALVVKNFPTSPKASEALLKVGEIFQKQKQNDKAREIYQQVVARYPNTTAAKTAAARIQQKRPLTVLNLMD